MIVANDAVRGSHFLFIKIKNYEERREVSATYHFHPPLQDLLVESLETSCGEV